MTLKKWKKLYNHYQKNYDFQLKRISYKELSQRVSEEEEWIPEKYERR